MRREREERERGEREEREETDLNDCDSHKSGLKTDTQADTHTEKLQNDW